MCVRECKSADEDEGLASNQLQKQKYEFNKKKKRDKAKFIF